MGSRGSPDDLWVVNRPDRTPEGFYTPGMSIVEDGRTAALGVRTSVTR
jgi:hypothetical protein